MPEFILGLAVIGSMLLLQGCAAVLVGGWIPTRSATLSSKLDLNVSSKLGEHSLDGGFEAKALSRR